VEIAKFLKIIDWRSVGELKLDGSTMRWHVVA
jgi:hypothetical protein